MSKESELSKQGFFTSSAIRRAIELRSSDNEISNLNPIRISDKEHVRVQVVFVNRSSLDDILKEEFLFKSVSRSVLGAGYRRLVDNHVVLEDAEHVMLSGAQLLKMIVSGIGSIKNEFSAIEDVFSDFSS